MRRRARSAVRSVAFSLPLLALLAGPAFGRSLLDGYPEKVRVQAAKVVEAAVPGREKDLVVEVHALRKAMLAQGILSVNVLPDMVFERAVRGGWKRDAAGVLRILAPVSALHLPMWAWLVKDDITRLNVGLLTEDLEGLAGAARRYGPALMGYAAWFLSLLAASACWFAAWAGAALYLRGRPSLEADICRFVKGTPRVEYAAALAAPALFLLPLAAGAGVAVAAPVWFLLCALYLRRKEVAIMTAAIALLGASVVAGGVVQTLVDAGAGSGRAGLLGAEGHLVARSESGSGDAGEVLSPEARSWIERFESARIEMQRGELSAAERSWTALLRNGKSVSAILNNRGVTRAQLGRIDQALADFEAAAAADPGHAPALWNAYQVYLARFNIDKARELQPAAWERIQEMEPYRFRPAEMEPGEWVASSVPVSELWKGYLAGRRGWLAAIERNASFARLFRPLSARGALGFLCAALLAAFGVRLAAWKRWASGACRACGVHLMMSGSREDADICTPCRSQVGGGVREGEEKNRRVAGIARHRLFVRIASVAVPGSGGLWAGKEFRAMICGMALSAALGALSLSAAGGRSGSALIVELQSIVRVWAAGAAGLIWAAGAAWGVWSFFGLQQRCNIAAVRAGR